MLKCKAEHPSPRVLSGDAEVEEATTLPLGRLRLAKGAHERRPDRRVVELRCSCGKGGVPVSHFGL